MSVVPARRRQGWPRPVVVAPDLAELHGPTSGVVELPHRLFWQPDRHVNLDNPALLRGMYETVLREAVSTEELRTWLDGPTLVEVWSDLYLPRWVRQAWQEAHPALRQAAGMAELDPFQAEVARVALQAGQLQGFALAGSNALAVHDIRL